MGKAESIEKVFLDFKIHGERERNRDKPINRWV